MGSSVKTAFHFRLASIGFPSASESLERKNGEGPRQEGCQDPDKKGSKKECYQKAGGKGKENTSKEGNQKGRKEAKGKEARISKEGQKASSKEGKEASTKKSKEAQEKEGTKERQKCTKTSNVCFLLVCSR